MSVDQMYLTESECKMGVYPFIDERSSSRKTATSAAQVSDVFDIEAPISSESFIVAQSFDILGVLEINSSESLDGSSSLFGDQFEAFSTDDLSLIRLMQAFLGGALLHAQQEEIPLP
jgi:hypothetical protein